MADVLTVDQRRLNMSRIRGRDTKPEWVIRRGLHARGLRYRLHAPDLPGRPDLVFPRFRAAIFVHGCFWHAHGCALSKFPTTRREFWREKLARNRERDQQALLRLHKAGWRVGLIWECSLRGAQRLNEGEVLAEIEAFVRESATTILEIVGAAGQPARGAIPSS